MTSIPLLSILAVLIFYPVFLVVYRLYFHPLSKFPGSKLAAATKWYQFYHDIIKGHGLFADQIREMHRTHGPIVRINPDELHVDDPEWYEVLYANNPTRRDKWPPAAKMAGNGEAGFGTVDHTLHGKRRAALSPLFSSRAIASADGIMQEKIQILSDTFQRKSVAKEVVELRGVFIAFMTDTIYQYTMGESMGLQSDEEGARRWWGTLEATSKMMPLVKQFPSLLALGKMVPIGVIRWLKPEMAGLLEIQEEMYARAKRYLLHEEKGHIESASGVEKRNNLLFRTLRDSALQANEKNIHRLAQEGFTVIVAGSETTARMLELGVFFILTNPSVLRRLQEEATIAMPDVCRKPSIKEVEKITYLNAVTREILRVSALVTSRLPLIAHEELRYKDWVITRKTPVGMTPHDVLLDPKVFPAPDAFDPDRWTHSPDLDRCYVPFGKGTRMCQGMRFALAEMNLALVVIFRRFDMELYETTKERDVDYVGDGFLGALHPDSVGVRIKVTGARQ